MSRTVTSTIKSFEGTVTFPDALTLPQALTIRRSVEKMRALRAEAVAGGRKEPAIEERDEAYAPALCACVEHADVKNFPEHPTVETWRFTPAKHAVEFFELLLQALLNLYYGEQDETDPNA